MYRKGQISFDYIAGFAIFMVSVIYITNTLIASVPQNYQLIEKNDMKQIAWIQPPTMRGAASDVTPVASWKMQGGRHGSRG